jgi:hypothetical protein
MLFSDDQVLLAKSGDDVAHTAVSTQVHSCIYFLTHKYGNV